MSIKVGVDGGEAPAFFIEREVSIDLSKIIPLRDAMTMYNQSYSNWDADYSVTELLVPPKIVQLRKRYRDYIQEKEDEITGDMIEKSLASLIGNGIHNILEFQLRRYAKAFPEAGYIIEKRLWDRICDRKISGKFDIFNFNHGNVLYDWKTTSVFKRIYGDYKSWEQQLNSYAYFLHINNVQVDKLKIIAIYTDWSKEKIFESKYPQKRVEEIPITKWSTKEQESFFLNRIELMKANENVSDAMLLPCTDVDMWAKKTQWAVYRLKDGKMPAKASRVVDTEAAALDWVEYKKLSEDDVTIVKRPGQRVRCNDWCNVNEFCNQYKEYKEGTE